MTKTVEDVAGNDGIKPNDMLNLIKGLWNIKMPLCIEGPPGGGKTQIARQAARELGVDYIEVHLPTMSVEHFGFPFPNKEKTQIHYLLQDWYPENGDSDRKTAAALREESNRLKLVETKENREQILKNDYEIAALIKSAEEKDARKAILCFDDRGQASRDIQCVLANILLERNLHGRKLPEGVMIISTGNRQQDRAGANKPLSHLRNREIVVELRTDLDSWIEWALKNNIKPEIIAFHKFTGGTVLHQFDPAAPANPTPRSWANGVSNVIGHIPKAAEFHSFKGSIGAGAATSFIGFLNIFRDLPDIEDAINNPDTAQLPNELSQKYAVTAALAVRTNKGNFDRIIRYINRIPKEFGVLFIKMVSIKSPEVAETKGYIEWSVKNVHITMGA